MQKAKIVCVNVAAKDMENHFSSEISFSQSYKLAWELALFACHLY
jgi:hypothetical protein